MSYRQHLTVYGHVHGVCKRTLDLAIAVMTLAILPISGSAFLWGYLHWEGRNRPKVYLATLAVTPFACIAFMALICILHLKLKWHQPILFRQLRIGYRGEQFVIFKLTTMIPGSDDGIAAIGRRDDPRVPWSGKILRASRLDELPNLWNVVSGHMTIVGPRPLMPSEHEHLRSHFPEQVSRRESVMPGVTCLSRIKHPDTPAHVGLYHDADYTHRASFPLDVAIICLTALAMLRKLLGRLEAPLHPELPVAQPQMLEVFELSDSTDPFGSPLTCLD